jgi:hypothetical protein
MAPERKREKGVRTKRAKQHIVPAAEQLLFAFLAQKEGSSTPFLLGRHDKRYSAQIDAATDRRFAQLSENGTHRFPKSGLYSPTSRNVPTVQKNGKI